MLGQPRPVRRTTSRMSNAAPPYIGASATSATSILMGRLPSRNSATRGAVKMSATAAEILRWERVIGAMAGVAAVLDDMLGLTLNFECRNRIAQAGAIFQYRLSGWEHVSCHTPRDWVGLTVPEVVGCWHEKTGDVGSVDRSEEHTSEL